LLSFKTPPLASQVTKKLFAISKKCNDRRLIGNRTQYYWIILADEFKMIGPNGKYSTKKEQIQYIKTDKSNYISFKFDIKRLEIVETAPP
jgi:hypothetical protein